MSGGTARKGRNHPPRAKKKDMKKKEIQASQKEFSRRPARGGKKGKAPVTEGEGKKQRSLGFWRQGKGKKEGAKHPDKLSETTTQED